jgi:L-asparaginase II
MQTPALLAERLRGGQVESIHFGHLVVVTPRGEVILELGDAQTSVFARSTLKPVQGLPLLMSGAADAWGLGSAAIAIAMGSHAGSARHLKEVEALLKCCGLGPEALQCGAHAPYDELSAQALTRAGLAPSALHNNCSGKHAAMLAVARHQGLDLQGYKAVEHPVQQAILAAVSALGDIPQTSLSHGIDGCGVPTWRLPLVSLAKIFARFGNPAEAPQEFSRALARQRNAFLAHPFLISGGDRLDTVLMEAAPRQLIAKIGGEGVHAGAIPALGLGWALKIADGNKRAIGPVLNRLLAKLGVSLLPSDALAAHLTPSILNRSGEEVGGWRAPW